MLRIILLLLLSTQMTEGNNRPTAGELFFPELINYVKNTQEIVNDKALMTLIDNNEYQKAFQQAPLLFVNFLLPNRIGYAQP